MSIKKEFVYDLIYDDLKKLNAIRLGFFKYFTDYQTYKDKVYNDTFEDDVLNELCNEYLKGFNESDIEILKDDLLNPFVTKVSNDIYDITSNITERELISEIYMNLIMNEYDTVLTLLEKLEQGDIYD